MAGYRLYFMTHDGHIEAAAEFERDSDEEAKLYAEEQRGVGAMELWSEARVVEKYPARP